MVLFYDIFGNSCCYMLTWCSLCVQLNRKDLTHLKVYAIDVDEADEVIFTKVV